MNIEKIKIRDNLYLIAVMDKKGRVIAAGAFGQQEDAETAAAIVNTVFVKKNEPSKVKLGDVIQMLSAPTSEAVS